MYIVITVGRFLSYLILIISIILTQIMMDVKIQSLV